MNGGTSEAISPGTDRESRRRRVARLAAQAAAGDVAACLCELAGVPRQVQRGRRPARRLPVAGRPGEVSLHHQEGPARRLSVRHVRRAARAMRANPCVQRNHRQADRGGLHPQRHRDLVPCDGAQHPGVRGATGRPGARELRLRPVHRRTGRALRGRAAGPDGGAVRWRPDRAPGAADPRFPARHHHGDAQLHAGHRRRIRTPGAGSGALQPAPGHLRGRALDQRHARCDPAAHGHGRRRHLRPVRSDGPGRGQRVRGDQGRPHHLGGPLLSRSDRSARPARRCPRASSANWCSPA